MRITTGTVCDGVIRLDSQCLPEGSTVTVLSNEGDETFELDESQEMMLLAAIDEADRGELIDASAMLRQIRGS